MKDGIDPQDLSDAMDFGKSALAERASVFVPTRPERLGIPKEHAELWAATRVQRDAKAAAELILGKKIQPKQIRGRCCLFVAGTTTTHYTGPTWKDAVARLIRLVAEGKADEQTRRIAAGIGVAAS